MTKLEKIVEPIPASLCGIIAALIGFICSIITVFLFPGYSLFKNLVSDLGYWKISPGYMIFNIGLILTGILGIPLIINVGKLLMESENINNNIKKFDLRKPIVSLAIFGSISLSLVGAFPSLYEIKIILYLHAIFAFAAFICGGVYLGGFGYYMTKAENFSLTEVFVTFSACFVFILHLFCLLPITEWLGLFALLFWLFFNGNYIIHLKHKK